MSTTSRIKVAVAVAIAAGAVALGGFAAAGSADSTPRADEGQPGQRMGRHGGEGHGHAGWRGGGGTPLSSSEARSVRLTYLTEEEKVARDVYVALAELYPDTPFAQIAASEQRHMDALGRQLERAGLSNPNDTLEVGEFRSAELQRLYDDLVAQGSTSRAAALGVGRTIERTDIKDLRANAERVDDAMLKRVFTNLERASRRHLAMFTAA